MMERHDHNNPWADKLQDIRLPEQEVAWEAMEAVLDREMPVHKWRDRRRWLLLIILLLLLIGVCNCPARRLAGDKERAGWKGAGGADSGTAGVSRDGAREKTGLGGTDRTSGVDTGDRANGPDRADGPGGTDMTGGVDRKGGVDRLGRAGRTDKSGGVRDTMNRTDRTDTADRTAGTDRSSRKDRVDGTNTKDRADRTFESRGGRDSVHESVTGGSEGEKKVTNATRRERNFNEHMEGGADGGTKKRGRRVMHAVRKEGPDTTGSVIGGKRGHGKKNEPVGGRGMAGRRGSVDRSGAAGDTVQVSDRGLVRDSTMVGGRGAVGGSDTVRGPGTVRGTGTQSGPGGKVAAKDTVSGKGKMAVAKPPPKPKADSILQMKGWLAGVGLNQFFTVGGQQASNYNSSGTTGGISDYIPVPMVRYYFNRKLYVQLEAQFNAPQYTTKDLLASQSKPDSATIPGRVLRTSLYIKKLFYFNLPLSVHYSPIPNLYIGGGVQYARLTNGVALYQDSSHNIFLGGRDSLRASKIMSFKNDTTYSKLKTNEFRLLLDLNYNYKRFVIGARYNRALSDFIHLQLSNTQVTQSRNSSFQVYLRYILWDGRKKVQNGPEVRRPEDRH